MKLLSLIIVLRCRSKKLREAALMLPNRWDASVPVGADEDENVEQRKWGEPRQFDLMYKLIGI